MARHLLGRLTVSTATSSVESVKSICRLSGLHLDPRQEVKPRGPILPLGAQITDFGDHALVGIPNAKRAAYLDVIRHALSTNALPLARLPSSWGLGFPQSLFFGRYGRALHSDITSRQHSPVSKGKAPLSSALRKTLKRRGVRLESHRLVLSRSIPPLRFLYTPMHRAKGCGHCAVRQQRCAGVCCPYARPGVDARCRP